MGLPKKGLRTIVVENVTFKWLFKGKVFVESSSDDDKGLLVVDFGWYDV